MTEPAGRGATAAGTNTVVLLAGGVGSRVGLDIPKQLIKIAGRPIIEHTLEVLAASFGEQVAERLAAGSYDTVVLVGGDGAAAALHRVGADAIRVHGTLAPGVPVGTILGGVAHGVRVVTKSGGFGRSDSLLEIVDRLQSSPSIGEEQP